MQVKWSSKMDQTRWDRDPGSGSIWVGHPAIARGIIRFLNWLQRVRARFNTEASSRDR